MKRAEKIVVTITDKDGKVETHTITGKHGFVAHDHGYDFETGEFSLRTEYSTVRLQMSIPEKGREPAKEFDQTYDYHPSKRPEEDSRKRTRGSRHKSNYVNSITETDFGGAEAHHGRKRVKRSAVSRP